MLKLLQKKGRSCLLYVGNANKTEKLMKATFLFLKLLNRKKSSPCKKVACSVKPIKMFSAKLTIDSQIIIKNN